MKKVKSQKNNFQINVFANSFAKKCCDDHSEEDECSVDEASQVSTFPSNVQNKYPKMWLKVKNMIAKKNFLVKKLKP